VCIDPTKKSNRKCKEDKGREEFEKKQTIEWNERDVRVKKTQTERDVWKLSSLLAESF
jgi:hypothetical protein